MTGKKIGVAGAALAIGVLTMLASPAQAQVGAAVPRQAAQSGNAMVAEAAALVRNLYAADARAEQGGGPGPLQGQGADRYFTADIVTLLRSGEIGAHPLYGAQDFDGRIDRIAPDAEQPMYRGMITIHVDFTNFGQSQRATFFLRADTDRQGAPLRIFRVEHDGWAYP
jgi:hypothetical protein